MSARESADRTVLGAIVVFTEDMILAIIFIIIVILFLYFLL